MMFYNAHNGKMRRLMDTAAGEALLTKNNEENMDIVEYMTSNSYRWPAKRTIMKR